MTEPNNQWIGDFHKALEERKEPRVEAPKPAEPAPTSNPSQGLADWVKKMGGALTESDFRRIASTFPTRVDGAMYGQPTLPEGMSYFDRTIALQLEEQRERIAAEFFDRAFEPDLLYCGKIAYTRREIGDNVRKGPKPEPDKPPQPAALPPVSPRDEELASRALEYVVGPLADIAQACAIAREEGFQAGRGAEAFEVDWRTDVVPQYPQFSISYDAWRGLNASSSDEQVASEALASADAERASRQYWEDQRGLDNPL